MLTSVVIEFFVVVICVIIYLKGYLPYNNINDVKVIDPPSSILTHSINTSEVYGPEIDRLVFIVIDALRTDFITEVYTPYTYKEKACVMNVKVEAPTVTMPRIKALTTGTIPQYVDIILNLGEVTKVHDSFLHRANAAGKKMVFYGDNTWLKLFPEMFHRYDGTTSFFVHDFYEVDDNVTRHVPNELQKDDWDMMFLHYLGLDHIGHVKGPSSNLIELKLHEMDEVIRSVHAAMKTWDKRTLLVVTGDHGMKDSGGHGGTSYAETHVPLVVFGNFSCSSERHLTQNDVAVTVSTLFGINIPATSTGKLILDFFDSQNLETLLYKMHYNVNILQSKSRVCEDTLEEAFILHGKYLTFHDDDIGTEVKVLYDHCSEEICSEVIKTSVEQQVKLLIFSIIMTANNLINIVIAFLVGNFKPKFLSIILVTVYAISHFYLNNVYMEFALTVSLIPVILRNLIIHRKFLKNIDWITVLVVTHAVLLMSSSFIEEEHQIVYFYTCAASIVIFYNVAKESFPYSLAALFTVSGLRVLRLMHTIGDKYAGHPDMRQWFTNDDNLEALLLFHAISLFFVFVSLNKLFKCSFTSNMLMTIMLVSTFIYKTLHSSVILGQVLWACVVLATVSQFLTKSKLSSNIIFMWILTITVLLQPYNVILIPFSLMGFYANQKFIRNTTCKVIVNIWFGYTLFFCQGHDSTLASVDISVGYIGSTAYVPEIVVFLTLCHIYAFPVLILMLMIKENWRQSDVVCILSIILRVINLLVVYIISLIGRTHLFVWSVFTPKLLIESTHTAVLFLEIFILFVFTYYNKKV